LTVVFFFAGGEKLIFNGVLYKYAIDTILNMDKTGPFWMYGGREVESALMLFFFSPFTEERCSKGRNDSLAMKGAGNELKGMIRFMEAARKVRGIYTPLMALIDYHGFEFFNPFSF
jgi:hypothetical protein